MVAWLFGSVAKGSEKLSSDIDIALLAGRGSLTQKYAVEDSPFPGGGPGLETGTLAFFAYNTGFRDYDMGYASAIAYVLTIILFILSFFYMRFILPRGK